LIKGERMSLFDLISNIIRNASGSGRASLKDAYLGEKAPKGPGVYKIFHNNKLMKVGKANDGLRKRFSDYYRGVEGGTAALKYITTANRDEVIVQWRECPVEKCRELETKMHDSAINSGETLPWSDRR